MNSDPYSRLASRLDALPNGFPETPDGIELRLLAKLFNPAEAALAAELRLTKEPVESIASRVGKDPGETKSLLKGMVRKGLIRAGKTDNGLGYALLPFVVGIYENQLGTMDSELAALFETYYLSAFGKTLGVTPSVHRVIPIGESIKTDMEVHPYESAIDIVNQAQAWGVMDCICRKQKALIGDPCDHPIDVCMVLYKSPGVFAGSTTIRELSKEQALNTLERAAGAGLVHSVSNNQKGTWYICNCCTCSCGILRGMADLGLANVVARSAFVNQVDEDLCVGCELCVDECQFDALTMNGTVHVDESRCVGCGVCVQSCQDEALSLVRRPEEEIKPVPTTEMDWLMQRAATRGLNLEEVL